MSRQRISRNERSWATMVEPVTAKAAARRPNVKGGRMTDEYALQTEQRHVWFPPVVLVGMSSNTNSAKRWLAGVVLAHLIISIAHGNAHAGAQVPLSPAANLFVFTVIVAGPLIGLVLLWPAPRLGSWIIALTMAGALVVGVVEQFVLLSRCNVGHVAEE